jgi:hypothetical protein
MTLSDSQLIIYLRTFKKWNKHILAVSLLSSYKHFNSAFWARDGRTYRIFLLKGRRMLTSFPLCTRLSAIIYWSHLQCFKWNLKIHHNFSHYESLSLISNYFEGRRHDWQLRSRNLNHFRNFSFSLSIFEQLTKNLLDENSKFLYDKWNRHQFRTKTIETCFHLWDVNLHERIQWFTHVDCIGKKHFTLYLKNSRILLIIVYELTKTSLTVVQESYITDDVISEKHKHVWYER